MDIKILLLVFVLRTLAAEIENAPVAPAPTLPDLDFSAFPSYIQRLLANRPSIDHVQSEPLSAPSEQPLRTPNTYGMNLRGDKMEIWNNIGGRNLYINDFAPSKLPSASTEKSEIYDETSQTSQEKIPANRNHKDTGDHNQKFTSVTIPQNLRVLIPEAATNQKNNNGNNKKNSSFATRKPKIRNTSHKILRLKQLVIGNYNDSTEYNQKVIRNTTLHLSKNIPAILKDNKEDTTLKPADISNTTYQTLTDENINQEDKSRENDEESNITDEEKESVENTDEKDEIEKSFDNISAVIGSNSDDMKNLSSKTYGMKLTGDHGYIWNDLSRPGIHYNVGEMSNSENTNLTNIDESTSKPPLLENPDENTNEFNITTGVEKDNELDMPITTDNFTDSTSSEIKDENGTELYEKATTETYIDNSTAEENNTKDDDEPPKKITPELDELLKKYIEKLVKEEVAKQLRKNSTEMETEIKNGSGNSNSSHGETKKEDELSIDNDKNQIDCKQYNQTRDANSTKCQYNSGNVIGNTNIFVFYPNDKTLQSIINDTVKGRPVNELLDFINSTVSNDEKKPGSEISNTLIEEKKIPVIAKNKEPSSDEVYEGIEKYKDDDDIEAEAVKTLTSQGNNNNTSVDSSAIDDESKTTMNSTARPEGIEVDETSDSSEGS
ncbi:jg23385 [Pararge aegeria aegeria]|uniref:Jg23385 protein n=1 Tax=Pararge aegeria aegeria TaxID=348720 RepID=A0A8S4RJG9_9NEOP|nr:jg23385 [Pararge aegeria aegeria]